MAAVGGTRARTRAMYNRRGRQENWTLTVRKPGAACGDRVEMLEMAGVVPRGGFSALDTARVDTSTVQYAEGVSCVLVFVSPRGFVVSGLACLRTVWA